MSNTIVTADILQKKLIKLLDKRLVSKAFTNREYEGQLKQQGDTVRVETFPDVARGTGGTAGATITGADFAVTSETLVVGQVAQINRHIQKYEKVRSNFDLMNKLADRMSYGLADIYDQHILTTMKDDCLAGNQLFEGAPVALDKDNIFEYIQELGITLSNNNVQKSQRFIVASPAICSLVVQSDVFDATDKGLKARIEGYVGRYGGFDFYESNNTPANYILA